MPSLKKEVDVDFEVWCGICGKGVCYHTDVNGDQLTVTCPDCQDSIKALKNEIKTLKRRLRDTKAKKMVAKRK